MISVDWFSVFLAQVVDARQTRPDHLEEGVATPDGVGSALYDVLKINGMAMVMKYQFPIIKTIDDVIPAIKDKKEFLVADKKSYKVINYTVAFQDTFDVNYDDMVDNYGAIIPAAWIRRECRGIIFDKKGNLISRPFHKFFNVGEKPETRTSMLNMDLPHIVMEKIDGSMVRPIICEGSIGAVPHDDVYPGKWVAMNRDEWTPEIQHVRMATKMGFTDIADMADAVADIPLRKWMAHILIDMNATPLFEFVAPDNRIVVTYAKPKMFLLAIRDNYTGRYWTRDEINRKNCPADMVPQHASVDGSMDAYVKQMSDQQHREGDVVQFSDGNMVKIKTDWYLRLHRTKDQIRNNRRLLDLIINNGIDDLLPNLDKVDYDRVVEFDKKFHEIFNKTADSLETLAKDIVEKATIPSHFDNSGTTPDRRMVATVLLPDSKLDKRLYGVIWGYLDGKEVRESFLNVIRKSTTTTKRYNEMAEFLGLDHSEEDKQEE